MQLTQAKSYQIKDPTYYFDCRFAINNIIMNDLHYPLALYVHHFLCFDANLVCVVIIDIVIVRHFSFSILICCLSKSTDRLSALAWLFLTSKIAIYLLNCEHYGISIIHLYILQSCINQLVRYWIVVHRPTLTQTRQVSISSEYVIISSLHQCTRVHVCLCARLFVRVSALFSSQIVRIRAYISIWQRIRAFGCRCDTHTHHTNNYACCHLFIHSLHV